MALFKPMAIISIVGAVILGILDSSKLQEILNQIAKGDY